MGESRRRDERRTDHVGVEDVPPRVRIHVGQTNEGADAGGVDQGVDAAETLGRFAHRRLAGLGAGHVTRDGQCPRARLRGGSLESLLPPGQQGCLRPALGRARSRCNARARSKLLRQPCARSSSDQLTAMLDSFLPPRFGGRADLWDIKGRQACLQGGRGPVEGPEGIPMDDIAVRKVALRTLVSAPCNR